MKPLYNSLLDELYKRCNEFIDAELLSVEVLTPTTIKLLLNTQDKARGYDWIALELLFEDVEDARIVENSKLKHIDSSEGLGFFYKEGKFVFHCGNSNRKSGTKDAICYIISNNLRYNEIEAIF